MNHSLKLIHALLMALVLAALTTAASAVDRVTLKSGKVVEGTIVREVEGAVWIDIKVGGLSQIAMYGPSDISKVEREAGAEAASAKPLSEQKKTAAPATGSKVPKAAIITLGDNENGNMVGVFMTADILKRAIPVLEQEIGNDKTGVLVLRIHSGGGYGTEVPKINDVIQKEFKTRWRTVAWIETAISAAAMSCQGVEEIYFMPQGNYGACVGFYGTFDKPVEGFELEQSLAMMEEISRQGNYDTRIMRSMQVQDPLSATILPSGEVKYYKDATSGEIVVNREKEILTFNANSALKVHFSRGTAATTDELTRLMNYKELEWVGKRSKVAPYPVCKAEQMQIDFRHEVKIDESALQNTYGTYQREVAAAESEQDPKERGRYVGKARQLLDKIKGMIKNNPAFKLTVFGGKEQYDDFIKREEKRLKDLLRR